MTVVVVRSDFGPKNDNLSPFIVWLKIQLITESDKNDTAVAYCQQIDIRINTDEHSDKYLFKKNNIQINILYFVVMEYSVGYLLPMRLLLPERLQSCLNVLPKWWAERNQTSLLRRLGWFQMPHQTNLQQEQNPKSLLYRSRLPRCC